MHKVDYGLYDEARRHIIYICKIVIAVVDDKAIQHVYVYTAMMCPSGSPVYFWTFVFSTIFFISSFSRSHYILWQFLFIKDNNNKNKAIPS